MPDSYVVVTQEASGPTGLGGSMGLGESLFKESLLMQMAKIRRDGGKPPEVLKPHTPAVACDDQIGVPAKGGVLEVKYGDPDFDSKLLNTRGYSTLKITGMPENVHLRTWIDKDGYFFWFQNGNDGKAHHHYNPGLKLIDLNNGNCRLDVAMEQLDASDKFFGPNQNRKTGFDSFSPKTDVLSYFKKMSDLSDQALDIQAQALQQGAIGNKNPYFHLYLSDVYLTQAMKPIVDAVVSGRPVNLGNPETIKKIDAAINEAKVAEQFSRDACYNNNSLPPANVFMPMAPFGYYDDPYHFWGGSLYQAQRREAALATIRYLYTTQAIPKYLNQIAPNGFEVLPPALPPR